MLVKEHKRKCISGSGQGGIQNIVRAGWYYLTYFMANLYLRPTQKNLKSVTSLGKKVKIHGVENAFLSQSDDQQGPLSKTSSIIPFPPELFTDLFSELCVAATTTGRRKAQQTGCFPFRYRAQHLLVGGDAIFEAFPLSHLFTGLIHPSTSQTL